jgi:uncharacterized protein (TIRG00374 family)
LLLRAVAGAAITGLFLLLLSRYLDWQRFVALLRQSRPPLLAFAFAMYIGLYAVRALRFKLITPSAPYGAMFAITCVHNLLLRLLPMRTGDLSYAFLAKRAGLAGLGEGLISLVLVRIFDAGTVVVLFGATLALNRGVYRGDPRVGFVAAGAVLVCGILAVVFFRQLLGAGVALLRGLGRLVGANRQERLRRLLDRVETSVRSFAATPARVLFWVAVITACQWLLNFLIFFAIMRGFALRVSVAQVVLGGTAAVVSGFLPLGGIGTFGTLEAGWALGFALVGLEPSVAVASAFGFSIVTLLYGTPLGLVGWIALSRRSGGEHPAQARETSDDTPSDAQR